MTPVPPQQSAVERLLAFAQHMRGQGFNVDDIESTTSDLTRLNAKVEELERELEERSAREATITALEAENKRLREANEALARGLEFYANPAVYAPHPHGPAFDRRDISYRAKNALAEFRGEAELPPNYAACCSSTNLDACDCVNKRHIRVLFSRGGKRKYQPIGDPL